MKKDNPLKELYGFVKKKGLKKIPKQIVKETRKELGIDSLSKE